MYFGFSPTMAGRSAGSATVLAPSCCRMTSRTRRSCPVESRTAAWISPRKWFSIHSRVKSLGTLMVNASSLSSAPAASANHVRYVVSFSAPLSFSATSVQSVSAVGSIGRSTRVSAHPSVGADGQP